MNVKLFVPQDAAAVALDADAVAEADTALQGAPHASPQLRETVLLAAAMRARSKSARTAPLRR